MYRYLKTGCLAAAVLVSLVSCKNLFSDLAVPKTLSVKSKATYNVSLGSVSDTLSKYLSASVLQENLKSSATDTTLKVYDYNPGGTASIQEFLIEYPITEYQLDFSKMVEDALGDSLADMTFDSYTVSVPSVSRDFSQTATIAASDITDGIGAPVLSSDTVDIPESSSGATISGLSRDVTIGVDSATYRSGTLTFVFTYDSSTGTPSGSKTVTVQLENPSGTVITSGSGTGSDSADISVPLDLAGKTLTGSMTLVIGGTVGGTDGTTDTYTLTGGISSDAVLSKVTGITKSGISVSVPSQSVSAANSQVSSATVSSGSLFVRAAVPSGWSGVTCTFTPPAISGGLVPTTSFADASAGGYLFYKTLDLAGAAYTPATDVTVGAATATVDLADATVVFDSSGAASIVVTGNCSITGLSVVTIDPANLSSAVPSLSLDKTLATLCPVVTQVTGASVEVSGSLTNGLPSGNTIKLTTDVTLASTTTPISASFDGGSAAQTFSGTCPASGTVTLSSTSPVKINAGILLPGQTSATTDTITLHDIELGTDYSFAASFTLTMDWDTVTVQPSDIVSNLASGTVSTNIDFGTIFNSFSDKIDLSTVRFDEVPAYLYVTAPESVADALGGTGTLTVTYNGGSSLGIDHQSVNILTSDLDLGSTSDTYTGTPFADTTSYSAETNAFADLINNHRTTPITSIEYSMSLATSSTGIQITNPAKNSASSLSTVSVKAVIELPLSLTISGTSGGTGLTVDMADMADIYGGDTTKDLLDRGSDFDSSDVTKYTDAIEYFRINYTLDNPLTLASGSAITLDVADAASTLSWQLSTSGSSVDLSSTDIRRILETSPFHPSIVVTVPEGTYSIPRNCSFGINASVQIKTDGTVKIWGDD